MEVFAGEKAFNRFKDWLPEDTVTRVQGVRRRHQGPAHDPESAAASAR
jgi:isocitrate dehydrogenase